MKKEYPANMMPKEYRPTSLLLTDLEKANLKIYRLKECLKTAIEAFESMGVVLSTSEAENTAKTALKRIREKMKNDLF